MTDHETNDGDGAVSDQRSARTATRRIHSRRGFLRTTVGAGAILAGLGVGVAGGAQVTDSTISVSSVDSGSATNTAGVSYENGTVVVDGSMGVSTPCHTAELGDVHFEGDDLYVPVTSVSTLSEGEVCTHVLAAVNYTAEVAVDEIPSSVVVQHQSMDGWEQAYALDHEGPGAPANLTVTETTDSSISLAWDPPANDGAGIDHYSVQVIWTDVAVIFDTGQTSVTLDGSRQGVRISTGTTYEISVQAIDTRDVGSNWSEKVTATPGESGPILPTPGNLSIEGKTARTVDLSWELIAPTVEDWEYTLDHVNVYVDGALHHQVSNGGIGTTVDGLDPGTEYVFTIKGADASGNETTGMTASTTTRSLDDWPVPVGETVPQDIDGDGVYMDMNANGRIDNNDVVTYFEFMDDQSMTDHSSFYDYNGNGRIDFDDVVTLFESL